MGVKQLGIAVLLVAAMASAVRSQVFFTAPIIARPVQPAGPRPLDDSGNPPFDPAQIQQAYGVNNLAAYGAGQTIAIVDAYNYPNALSALNTFSSDPLGSSYPTYSLPQFNVPGGPTFTQLNQSGGAALPGTDPAGAGNDNWEFEEALDIEYAHTLAPYANIILYEANSASGTNLYAAVTTAKNNSAVSVISMSWGGGESGSETRSDSTFTTPSSRLAAKQGVTFVASAGDTGGQVSYPAASPNVVAVGGTSLTLNSNNSYSGESAWSDGGGGTSSVESKPSYQTSYGTLNGGLLASTTKRATPDVAFVADPNTGVIDYDPYNGGYYQIGGTSLSAPCWAGLIADADGLRVANGHGTLDGRSQTLPALYSLPNTDFHEVTSGNNGVYSAGPGYNLCTGLGTPVANSLVPDLAAYGVVTSTTYRLVAATTTPTIHVSSASTSNSSVVTTTITNTGSPGQDTLNYTGLGAGSSPSATVSGSPQNNANPLALGASSSPVSQTFQSATAGVFTLTGSVATVSNSSAPGTPTLSGSTPVTVTVYNLASASTVSTPISLGIVHAGGTFSPQALTLQNAAPSGYSENLDATVTAGGQATASGSISGLAPQSSDSTSLVIGLSGASMPGAVNGTVILNLQSDGAGNSGLGLTSLGTQAISVSGSVYSGMAQWNQSGAGNWSPDGNWADTLGNGAAVRPAFTATPAIRPPSATPSAAVRRP